MTNDYILSLLTKPELQGTQDLEMLKDMLRQGDSRINSIYLGAGTFVTPQQVKDFTASGAKDIQEYYRQQKDSAQKSFQTESGATADQYQINLQKLANKLEEDKRQLDDTEGKSGTWSSSARERRLGNLQDTHNLDMRSLFSGAKTNLDRTALSAEKELGSDISVPQLQELQTNLSQTSPASTFKSSGYKYSPFGTIGNIEKGKRLGSDVLGKDLMSRAYYNPFKNI